MFNLEKNLKSAIGYLELGIIEGALNEIECIQPEVKNSSAVLGVRMEIYRAAEKWTFMEAAISVKKSCLRTYRTEVGFV